MENCVNIKSSIMGFANQPWMPRIAHGGIDAMTVDGMVAGH